MTWFRLGWTLWFALGLMLTTASDLRLRSLPLGPGEVMLGVWAAVELLVLVSRGRRANTPVLRTTLLFWAAAFCFLVAGALMASFLGVSARGGGRDALAFLFTATVTLIYLARPESEGRVRSTVGIVVGVTICILGFLFVYGLFVSPSLGPVTLWYGPRFAGLSKNPNQLALLLCAVPFAALYFYLATSGVVRKLWYLAVGTVSLIIGVATQSDALLVSWIAGATLAATLLWLHMLRSTGRNYVLSAALLLGVPLAAVGAVILYGPIVYGMITEMGTEVYAAGNQGAVRITLYVNGLRALATSLLVGLGPGAHSGMEGPFNGSEAHNTFIDWSASTGILGLAAYLWLVGRVAVQAHRARRPVLVVAVVTLISFSFFHYVLRHPIFWFYLLSMAHFARLSVVNRNVNPGSARPARGVLRRSTPGAFRRPERRI